jgi:hypothetical protein
MHRSWNPIENSDSIVLKKRDGNRDLLRLAGYISLESHAGQDKPFIIMSIVTIVSGSQIIESVLSPPSQRLARESVGLTWPNDNTLHRCIIPS